MMKPTGLLAATGVLLILGGTIWYFQKHPKAPDTSATPAAPKILTVTEDQIQGIRISKTGSDPIDLKTESGKWVIAGPKPIPADLDTIHSFTGALAGLTADRLIDEHPADLNTFGLNVPSEELDITLKSGAVNKVILGADTPAGTGVYAKLDGKPAVYTLTTATKSTFDKTIADLRDKRLVPFNQDKVTAISVTSKGPAFTFGRNAQGEWQIVKPSPMRADSSQVDQLLSKLKEAKMDTAAADTKVIEDGFAKGTEVGTVTVTDNSGPIAITVHKGKDNTYYARSSALEGTYKLAGDLAEGINDRDLDSFRNKKLFEFGFSDPSKIEIDGASYTKSGDKWSGPKGQYDAGSIQSVIDKLRDLSASKFVPKLEGTLSLSLVVTSGDRNKVEKVILNKAGEDYDTMREGDPTVYVVSAASYGDLRKAIDGIKTLQPSSTKK